MPDTLLRLLVNKIDTIEKKIDKTVEHIGEINITLAKQHVSLDAHMRRSDLLEKQVALAEKKVYTMDGTFKMMMSLGICIGVLTALIKYFKGI